MGEGGPRVEMAEEESEEEERRLRWEGATAIALM